MTRQTREQEGIERESKIERIYLERDGYCRDFSGHWLKEVEPKGLPFCVSVEGLASLLDIVQVDDQIKREIRNKDIRDARFYTRSETSFESVIYKLNEDGETEHPQSMCTYAVQIYGFKPGKDKIK
jgi:hypothetical protein